MRLQRNATACAALLLVACARDGEPVATPSSAALGAAQVATVNGEPIPESVFRYYVINLKRKSADQLTPQEHEQALEELVQVKLLADAARDRGLLNERTIAAELELQRLQLAARRMALRYLEQNPATDAEIRDLYERNLPELSATEYKARHILVDTEDAARTAIERLQGGADFATLALELSSGPTGNNGGDLGWITAESMVEPVAEAVRNMEPGTFSTEPVATDFGFHVLLLEDVRSRAPPTLDAIRAELAAAVDREKLEGFMKVLRDESTVIAAGPTSR